MLGVAIIGCGDMGTKHATAWSAQDDVRVVSVCDHQESRANRLANEHNAIAHDRWQDAIGEDHVDIVSVCVPVCHHHDVTVAAANAGRHVLCEKAMALTLNEADEMIAVTDANKVKLAVCHQYRAFSRFRIMKQLVADGRLGSPLYIRFSELREVRPKLAMHERSLNGGPIHDMTGHLFDLARFLTDSEPLSVAATGTVIGAGKERLQTVSDFGIDTGEIQGRFTGGHCLTIGINWGLPEGTPGHCHDLVHGPNGVAYSEDLKNPDRFLGDVSDSVRLVVKDAGGTERIDCDADADGPEPCVAELLDAIRVGKSSQFDGRNGRAALQLILASLEAMETGQTVVL